MKKINLKDLDTDQLIRIIKSAETISPKVCSEIDEENKLAEIEAAEKERLEELLGELESMAHIETIEIFTYLLEIDNYLISHHDTRGGDLRLQFEEKNTKQCFYFRIKDRPLEEQLLITKALYKKMSQGLTKAQ